MDWKEACLIIADLAEKYRHDKRIHEALVMVTTDAGLFECLIPDDAKETIREVYGNKQLKIGESA